MYTKIKYFFIIIHLISNYTFCQDFYTIKEIKRLPKVEILQLPNNIIDTLSFKEIDVIDTTFKSKKVIACLPLKHILITSFYGERIDPFTWEKKFHKGIDLKAKNDTVKCIMAGVIEEVGYNRRLGIFVRVKHGHYSSVYGHLNKIFVSTNQRVEAMENIAITGSTGRSTGEHLHFTLLLNKKSIDPLPFLKSIYLYSLSVQ